MIADKSMVFLEGTEVTLRSGLRVGGRGTRARWGAGILLALLPTSACSLMPGELNLSPFYRHRLDEEGGVLEMDVLWPIIHYEQTPEGGDDFRIRPFYRYISGETITGEPAWEHQFLWPFGRVRSDENESFSRLFPLWYHVSRTNELAQRETDWYFLFPFFWGGSREDGEEDYLSFFPVYGDMPGFLTYDRFRFVLFPLYVSTEKSGHTNHVVLWPLGNISSDEDPEGRESTRLLPFFSRDVDPGRFERYWLMWPLLNWGTEGMDTVDPISVFWFWPLIGLQNSDSVAAWSVLWPFFQKYREEGGMYRLDLFWPLFRYHENQNPDGDHLVSWWLWPFYSRTTSETQSTWSTLWPIIWWREYYDPGGVQTQRWVVPFYWYTARSYDDGGEDSFLNLWPLLQLASTREGRGEWRFPSIWPWRGGNAYGIQENYGWLWTLASGNQRAPDDTSTELTANLYTTRQRHGRRQTSVPFLFNYESDEDGAVLRLFQFIPIPLGGGSTTVER